MTLVWHRLDLRTSDNKVVAEPGESAIPVFVADSEIFESELVSDGRKKFILESLRDLNRQYSERGTHLALLESRRPVEKLAKLSAEHGEEVKFNYSSFPELRKYRERALENDFEGFAGRGIRRNAENSREGWRKHISDWFGSEKFTPPREIRDNPVESETSISELEEKYEIQPEKDAPEGGRKQALDRLNEFESIIDGYGGCISKPLRAEENTSQLSPYIAHGCLSVREVFQRFRNEDSQSAEMFRDRLVWNRHFRQKLEDNPDLVREAINPVYRGLHLGNRDEEKSRRWKKGKTGYPLVDASMRALVKTGWMTFRMRAMCASFYSYILKQWWKDGADFFYRHLIDADPAINYYQWQMQSGLIGVHANRIYDPTKQVKDNDPNGSYIRKYVPELRNVPDEYIAEPWKMPESVQKECGVEIGRNYPEPIDDYQREAEKAREFFKKNAPRAYEALLDDEVWRKASLSDRHSRKKIREKAREKYQESDQKSLDSF